MLSRNATSTDYNHGFDLIRGIAAIAVVLHHFSFRIDVPDLFHHGYLAVDLFFVLSGAVIAKSYHRRIYSGSMSFPRFFEVRATRLLPVLVLGTVIGFAAELAHPGVDLSAAHVSTLSFTFFMSLVLVPAFWEPLLDHSLFPLNGPVWSLFFELMSNFAYYPVMRGTKAYIGSAAIAAVAAPFLCWSSAVNGAINMGTTPEDFLGGFARVFVSFSVGFSIYHLCSPVASSRRRIRTWIVGLLLFAIFAVPVLPPGVNLPFDAACVGIVFPATIAVLSRFEQDARFERPSEWFGKMSYPLYAIHYPIVKVIAVVLSRLHLGVTVRVAVAVASTGALAVAAKLIFDRYDQPMRRALALRRSAVGARD